MADNQNITVVMPTELQQRAAMAAEVREMRKNPPDRAAVKGGQYRLQDGRVLNAEGQAVTAPDRRGEATSSESGPTAGSTSGGASAPRGELPDDFPARDALVGAGFDTYGKVRAASDAQLDELDGVGAATIARIREAQGS